ncbi:hypothetical protein ACFQDF_25515 [Ectobacillus funiculus]
MGLAYITDKFHIRKGFPSSSRIILEERGQERIESVLCYFKERGDSVERYEYILLNKEMSGRLDIGVSTLRKWAAALEKNGYSWEKNEDGTRYYTRYDEETLILFKTLVQEQKFNLDQAAKVIVSRRQGGRSSERAGGVLQENKGKSQSENQSDTHSLTPVSAVPSVLTEEAIQSLINYVKDQEQLNRSLIEKSKKWSKSDALITLC